MIKNVMEDVVKDVLTKHHDQLNLVCDCPKCQEDIMALALNQLPPCYISNHDRQPFIRAMHEADREGAMAVLMSVTRAAAMVSVNPRCERMNPPTSEI